MALPTLPVLLVASLAILYQFLLRDLLFTTLGYGRAVAPLSAFSARCEKIDDVGLEGCEDMWMHEPSGLLYMACGDSVGRTAWLPSIDHLNATGRTRKDGVAILDTRAQGPVQSRLKWIAAKGFKGVDGTEVLDLHGFDVSVTPGPTPLLKLLLINHRPPIDPISGELLDASKVGANSTIELFEAKLGEAEMKHLKTYAHPAIDTPNRVSFVDGGAFYFSNDRSSKVGFRRQLDFIIGGGTIGFCDDNDCKIAAAEGFAYPNGLKRGHDNRIYVPSSVTGEIHVMEVQADKSLKRVKTIKLPHPIDNLSIDKSGDIYAATFPVAHRFIASTKEPHDILPATAVWRIRQSGDLEYEIEKVLEDDEGGVLPCATVAIHDHQTGRIFLGGAVAPFITICETRR